MNGFVSFAYARWGRRAERRVPPSLQKELHKAHLPMRAGAFLAGLWLAAALVGGGISLLVLGILVALHVGVLFLALAPVTGFLFAGWALALGRLWLQNRAKEAERDIDESLPAAMNYMLALANAGLPPAQIWGSLARAESFGAISYEAERIRRDLSLFSRDILAALRDAQERTPSRRFHEFLQGAISSFQSGVELKDYLKSKGVQYQREAMEVQAQSIDTMSVMAEAFLVVVVAAPLFLLILLAVMAISQGTRVLAYGFGLVLVFLPLSQLVIGTLIQGMNPRTGT